LALGHIKAKTLGEQTSGKSMKNEFPRNSPSGVSPNSFTLLLVQETSYENMNI